MAGSLIGSTVTAGSIFQLKRLVSAEEAWLTGGHYLQRSVVTVAQEPVESSLGTSAPITPMLAIMPLLMSSSV